MWMMGYNYNDGGEFNSIQDSFNGRKLRTTLMPKPATAAATTNPQRIHGADFLALNHHFGMTEQNKRELSTQQVVASSRWNPTPEQLQSLEDLYRRGTRTPSSEQIQQITAQLRRYGKIEGKNVFYWFQNHKARERQKRRRQLEPNNNMENGEKKESQGVNRTVFEGEETKNWGSPTKSSTNAEKSSTKGSAKVTEAECKTDGWVQFDAEAELQQRRIFLERNATWQMMHLSSSSSSSPTNLLNFSSSAAATVTVTIPSTINTTMEQNLIIHSQDFNIFHEDLTHSTTCSGGVAAVGGGGGEAQTLQLFPLNGCVAENDEEELSGAAMNNTNATPFQFFEFLPLKN